MSIVWDVVNVAAIVAAARWMVVADRRIQKLERERRS